MNYKNYQRAFFISCALHLFILAGAAIMFANFSAAKPVPKLEVKMVNIDEYNQNNGNSSTELNTMGSTSHIDNKTDNSGVTVAKNVQNHSAMESQISDVGENATSSLVPSEIIKQHSNVPTTANASSVPSQVVMPAGSHGSQEASRRQMNGSKGGSEETGDSGIVGSGLAGGNFVSNGDGTYTALSSAGIDYNIVYSVEAHYPEEAKAVGYARNIRVEAVILVGLDGNVESVSILNNVPDLGFQEAARQALMQWKFSPIYYRGINIKMKFYKNIYFDPA